LARRAEGAWKTCFPAGARVLGNQTANGCQRLLTPVCVRSSRRVAAAAAAATAVGAHVPSSSSGLELDLRAPRRPVRATAPSSPLGGASSAAMPSCHGVGAGPGEVREHERLERHCPAPRPPRPAAAPSSFLRRGPRQRRQPSRRPAAAAAPSPAGFSLPCWPPAARQQKKMACGSHRHVAATSAKPHPKPPGWSNVNGFES